jgi:hypothetical protein
MIDQREARLIILRAELTARLKGVCAHWPEEMFAEMIRGLAALTLKYDDGDGGSPPHGIELNERMIEELKALAERSADFRQRSEGKSAEEPT